MFCGECGTQNPDINQFCKNCGKPLKRTQPQTAPAVPVAQQAPVVPAPATQVQGDESVPVSAEGVAKPARNWLAIVSFLASLAAWLVYPILLGFIAIGLGAAAIYTAKKNHAKLPVSAIIAIIIGVLAIVINFFWLDIFPPPAVLPPIR